MEWMGALNEAIEYMEHHSISDYIKYRRLSMAGEELARGNIKVIEEAYRYAHYQKMDLWEEEHEEMIEVVYEETKVSDRFWQMV